MSVVFIGGSRAISELNAVIRERLDALIARECSILVGDAAGADQAVQQYFAERKYQDVIVYCMDRCRHNIGHWPIRQIRRPDSRRDRAYYTLKDISMAQDASCGVMLWDAKSRGTLNNIRELLRLGKKTLAFLASENVFLKLSSVKDLSELLSRAEGLRISQIQAIEDAERQLVLSHHS